MILKRAMLEEDWSDEAIALRSNPNSPEYQPSPRKRSAPIKAKTLRFLRQEVAAKKKAESEVEQVKEHWAYLRRANDGAKKQWVVDNLFYFCLMFLTGPDGTPLRLEDFHVEILDKFFLGGRHDIMLPTDHAKSLIGTFVFPIASLCNDPNASHIICCSTFPDAKRRLATIRYELETNKTLIGTFPWVAKPIDKGATWSALDLNVEGKRSNMANPSVHAGTINADDIRGRRGKLIMDDIEGASSRNSPTKRRAIYDFVKLEAIRCWEDGRDSTRPLLANLGTPYDLNSVHFRLGSTLDGWEVTRYPAYIGDPDVKIWARQYLWPAKKEKVEKQRSTMSKLHFSIHYLLDPSGGDSTAMSYEEIANFAGGADFTQGQPVRLVTLDPASGVKGRRSDYAGLAVVEGEWKQGEVLPTLNVLEAWRFTEGIFEQCQMAAQVARTYGCPIIYETNSQQGANYGDVFKRMAPDVKLIGHYTGPHEKWDEGTRGITVIKTLVRERRLRVPQSRLEDEGIRTLLEEIRDLKFGTQSDDHICSALWFVVKWMELTMVKMANLPTFRLHFQQPSFGNSRGFGHYGR